MPLLGSTCFGAGESPRPMVSSAHGPVAFTTTAARTSRVEPSSSSRTRAPTSLPSSTRNDVTAA